MHDASREIQALEQAFWKSLVARDTPVAMGLLAPQALVVNGRGAIRFDPAQYAQLLRDPKHGLLDYTLSDMDVLFPGADVAIVTYRAHQTMQMDGRELTQDVVDSSTWMRLEGVWKCVAHTESEAADK